MVQKRSFEDGESIEISSKFPRLLEGSAQLVSFSESVFPEYSIQDPHISGFVKADTESNEKVSEPHEIITDIDTGLPSCNSNSNSSWAASSMSEEDSRAMEPLNVSFHPEVFTHDRPIRTFMHREDIYSLLLHYPPRKVVPIGPDHQADIPPCRSPLHKNLLGHLDEDEKRLMGTCVIPMLDVELSSSHDHEVGCGRTNCSCEDGRSVRCVRQHIAEAREKLGKAIGPENFEELGFHNMGEQVARQWSEKEEQLFHRVVFSNPASLGKSFWHSLSIFFPSRTKKEIVSYYFNVFILRRRALQNRNELMDIDSDNDEWQESDDFGENEQGMTEEDEDSAVESPVYHSRLDYNQRDLQDFDEESGELFNSQEFTGHFEDISKFFDKSNGSFLSYCYSSPTTGPHDETPWSEKGDREVQDDSCTSFDLGTSHGAQVWKNKNRLSSKETGKEHRTLGSHDRRVWDSGFLSSFKTEVDFLPTCSVIEEVFGEDSCNYKGKDGRT